MPKIIRFSVVLTVVLALSACNLFPPNQGLVQGTSVVKLIPQVENATDTFNTVGQVIRYRYIVTNTGNPELAGPVIVTDPGRPVTCPDLRTVGDGDGNLDGPSTETITCTGTYAITQADLNTGSVSNIATARVGNIDSLPTGVTVPMNAAPVSVLTLTKTANPMTYTQIGQTIIYSYVITNTGPQPLPPGQFTISDDRLGTPPSTPFNCNVATTAPLTTGQTVQCTANYIITQADMLVPSITNTATASAPGVPASGPAPATVTNLSMITATPTSTSSPSSNLVPGTTILHQVVKGEWLLQIARCYGANYDEVRNANPQIINPHLILPAMTVTVPRIGSVSKIYGPPCITLHTVGAGDTWESIALKYNADVKVLQARNAGALSVGRVLIIPLNSAGGSIAPLPAQPTFTPTATFTVTATPTLTFTPGPTSTATATATSTSASAACTFATPLELAANINPVQASSSPTFLTEYKDFLYFGADGGDGKGVELWKYDGTAPAGATNPSLVDDINKTAGAGSFPRDLTVYKTLLYFSADDGSGFRALYRYEPSIGVRLVTGSEGLDPWDLTVYKDLLYFSADDGKSVGRELYQVDATLNPPTLAWDINPGTGSSNPTDLTVYKDFLYFGADGGSNSVAPNAGVELWKYHPQPSSAEFVRDIAAGPTGSFPDHLAVLTKSADPNDDELYFSANGGSNSIPPNAGVELWKYVDTAPASATNPSLAKDIRSGPDSSSPSFLTEYSGALYFSADAGSNPIAPNPPNAGVELWVYDGTNLCLVADISPGSSSSFPSYLTPYGGWLYFSADGGSNPIAPNAGVELWRLPP